MVQHRRPREFRSRDADSLGLEAGESAVQKIFVLHGFSQIGTRTWRRSVPPAIAGWSMLTSRSEDCVDPPAIAGGTDLFQAQLLTSETRLTGLGLIVMNLLRLRSSCTIRARIWFCLSASTRTCLISAIGAAGFTTM